MKSIISKEKKQEIVNDICYFIEDGKTLRESLLIVGRENDGYPSFDTVESWGRSVATVESRKYAQQIAKSKELALENYKIEAVKIICEHISNGEAVINICKKGNSENLPNARTFHRWVARSKDFKDMYYRAKDIGFLLKEEELEAEGIQLGKDLLADKDTQKVANALVNLYRCRLSDLQYKAKLHNPKSYNESYKLQVLLEDYKNSVENSGLTAPVTSINLSGVKATEESNEDESS